MATIRLRKASNGNVRYTAIVRLRKGKTLLHTEAKTFAHRAAAERWGKAREVALENPAELVRTQLGEQTLKSLIRWYIDDFREISKWQRTKQAQLEFLERHPIGAANVMTMTAAALVDHVRLRRARGAGPATVSNDLTWIGVVLRAAKSVKQIPIKAEIVDEARTACRELRLIAKSRRRERRPTQEELTKLSDYFGRRDRRAEIPMLDIMWFAIESARRESEICRIEVEDNDAKERTGLVRDAKHPTAKLGNHRRFKYTAEAWTIVQRQPHKSGYVFPYNPRSVCAAFTRACKILGIVDLHFHDLRHEATSRLFERGYQIHEVALFTLHDSWNELKRYANLRPGQAREIPAHPAKSSGRRIVPCTKERVSAPSPADDQSARPDQPRSRARAISDLPI